MSQRFVKYHPVVRKSERDRLMLVAAAGFTCLLLTVFVFVLHNRSEANVPKEIQTASVEATRPAIHGVTLLAPTKNVAAGTKLSSIELKEIYWPRNRVPEGAIRDVAEVKNIYAKGNLTSDQPLVRANLSTQPNRSSITLRPGFRAITIDVDALSSVDQLAQPGTFVDVLLTYETEGISQTKILVQNVRVLSFGGVVEDEAMTEIESGAAARIARGNRGRAVSSTISLEVAVQDALTIQTAKTMGRLGLMLRPLEEELSAAGAINSIDEHAIEGEKKKATVAQAGNGECSKGRIKVSGREFLLGCDGGLSQVIDPYDP